MKFEIPNTVDEGADEIIIGETRKYNSKFVPDDFKPLSVHCRNDNKQVVGGLTGKTYWHYLDIEFLWVKETMRENGVAKQLIGLAEKEATRRGCKYSMLDTYEFQALGFYLKQGYEEFGQLEGYCGKYRRYYLKKRL